MHNLRSLLHRIDNNGYRLYKSLEGQYHFPEFTLGIDRIQSDPFAPPSKISLTVPLARTGFPAGFYDTPVRSMAFRDALARVFAKNIRRITKGNRGTGNSGVIAINYGGQTVLERNSIIIDKENITVRLVAGMPSLGRTVAAAEAEFMFFEEFPSLVREGLDMSRLDEKHFRSFITTAERREHIRAELGKRGLLAFIPDGAILPRRSGAEDTPLDGAVKFESPPSLGIRIDFPGGGYITGMGVPRGITLITGGGFHGKSTLMNALKSGVWGHVPGDGREYAVSLRETVMIRAEDGRSVSGVDISGFIGDLPGGKHTRDFSTENASGSTSQAANIMEAVEAGARVLLMDEDTSAMNFLIRDERMRELIPASNEPITPFIETARKLYDELGVSTVMVTGGSGDYLDIADTVIMMDNYRAADATARAREIALKHPRKITPPPERKLKTTHRVPQPDSVDPSRKKQKRDIEAFDTGIRFGRAKIELSEWEQVFDRTQYDTLGDILYYARVRKYIDGTRNIAEMIRAIENDIQSKGLDVLFDGTGREWSYYCGVRGIDIAAALNRLRTLKVGK